MAKKLLSLVLALAMVSSFACISAFAADAMVYDGVTATLDLEGAFEADGCDGAIWAKNGAELTINGDDADTVKSLVCTEHGYSMAVFAQDANVVINGGSYENEGDGIVDPNHVDLIYAKGNSSITINGGTFKCANPQWTLNCNDKSNAVITVKGGKFYQFDPSNTKVAPAGKTEVVVPEGYSVVKDGDWYEVVKNPRKIYNGTTETLILSGEYVVDGEKSAILAANGANLTINGTNNDIIKANGGYAIAVWSYNSDVVINGGYYTDDLCGEVTDHRDLIYASENGSITINGGTFKAATPQWTLNCLDNSDSLITVKGGKFYQFNPANARVGAGEVVVPEGYSVVKEGDWYKVVEEEAKIEFDSATSKVVDGKGALRFVFKATLPETTETYFGAYMLPLSVFTKTGVANAVRVQYAKTEVNDAETFSADLVKIPEKFFTTSIYAIPYIKTSNGISTFAGASASVNGALAE